jgi:biotin carboxylase
MGEKVRAAGVRAVRQKFSRRWDEVEAFLSEWNPSPFKVIVKPMESAGSEDVTLCLSMEELHAAYHRILGKVNGLGQVNEDVLVQEFLDGQEYVIDTASRDGEHKVVGIWEYDRRPRNGAGFVCHGQRLLLANESDRVQELIKYQLSVLDALDIKHGAGHGEVKFCNGEPVLVEVGSRCHGAEGLWCAIVDQVYGYNQATVTVDAYLHEAKFHVIPALPTERHGYGMMKFLMSNVEGTLKCWNPAMLDEITKMASFQGMELFLNPGDAVHPTIDCFTWGGVVKLAHADEATIKSNYQRLEEMENGSALLELE